MQRPNRYFRFEPVTVRAASRIARLGQLGQLPEHHARFYVRELSVMEPKAGSPAGGRLYRLALRRAELGHTPLGPASRQRLHGSVTAPKVNAVVR